MSSRWIQRQKGDAFVKARSVLGYRARSAFKLIEMDDKLQFLRNGATLDLGAAPGGWSQVAYDRSKKVIMSDILEIETIEKCHFIQGDFNQDDVRERIRIAAQKANVINVLCDMAPNCCGDAKTDHLRQTTLVLEALELALEVLPKHKNSVFLTKVFAGTREQEVFLEMKNYFEDCKRIRPKATRTESPELYMFGKGRL